MLPISKALQGYWPLEVNMNILTPVLVSFISGIPVLFLGFYYEWSVIFMCLLMAVPGLLAIIIDVQRNEVYRYKYFKGFE